MTRRRRRLSPAPFVALACVSCSALHATIGRGLGVGADVQVSGLLHGGAMVGMFFEAGWSYGEPPPEPGAEYLTIGLFHYSRCAFKHVARRHMCFGILPGLWRAESLDDHPWAIELGVALGLFSLRLGFDPTCVVSHPRDTAGSSDQADRRAP